MPKKSTFLPIRPKPLNLTSKPRKKAIKKAWKTPSLSDRQASLTGSIEPPVCACEATLLLACRLPTDPTLMQVLAQI